MQAYTLYKPTGPDGLNLRELSTYPLGSDDVLIRVRAIGINPVDLKTCHGKGMYETLRTHDPLIPGWDVAGEVAELGDRDSPFAVGDRVFGMIHFPGQGSAFADYVTAPVDQLALIPAGVGYAEAAATCLAALTAWQNLIQLGNVRAGQRVLIHAAGGGVGHCAVQLAKERGAYVIATSSASKRDFVLGLGADEHLDYDAVKFEEVLEPVDIVLDSLTPEHLERSLKVVKRGGHLFTIAAGISDQLKADADRQGVLVTHHLVKSDGKQMEALAERLGDGRLKPHVSRTFPFGQLPDALRELEAGHVEGKLVVRVD